MVIYLKGGVCVCVVCECVCGGERTDKGVCVCVSECVGGGGRNRKGCVCVLVGRK